MTHYCPRCGSILENASCPRCDVLDPQASPTPKTRFVVRRADVAAFVLSGLSGAAFGLLVAQWLFGGL